MLLVNEGQSCSEKLVADCIVFVLKCVHNCEKPFDSFVLKMQDIVLCGDVCSYVESTAGGTFAHVSEIVHETFGPAIKGWMMLQEAKEAGEPQNHTAQIMFIFDWHWCRNNTHIDHSKIVW